MSRQYRNGLPIGPDGMTKRERQNLRRREESRLRRLEKAKVALQDDNSDERIRLLEMKIEELQKQALSEDMVRDAIFKLSTSKSPLPKWMIESDPTAHATGVPTLFASDWHWGEVVNPREIGGVNSYNLDIAHTRAKALITRAINLLRYQLNNPSYPGIVFALGGDMVSGDIHDELKETNEAPSLPIVVDLIGVLRWCITELANEFGHVFVPCVCGNHGRQSKKPRAKQRAHTNYDWLVYTMLEKFFEGDDRVTFEIAEGSDLYYRVYGHRYLLTHGDQFRGGDGQIGMLGPVVRGDLRKRTRQSQVKQEYDTLVIGHWHQLCQMPSRIINGSLKGYDEFAWSCNFPFEEPQQALWITHPTHGITIQMPVKIETKATGENLGWVSWKTAG